MIEQYTSPAVVNNSQEPWLVGEGVSLSGSIAIPSLDFNFVTNAFPGTVTFTRASSATMFDSSGTLVYAPMNLFTYSEQFDDSAWTKTRSSIIADDVIAPDGGLTGDKLVEDTTASSSHQIQRSISVVSGITYTRSLYAKAAERGGFRFQFPSAIFGTAINAYFDLTNGVVAAVTSPGVASITPVGNGWYRCTLTATATATGSGTEISCGLTNSPTNPSYTGDGTSGIYIWGAQFNQTPMQGGVTADLSTYYPTTSAAYQGPRLDYNPATLAARGLLIEEQRTNSIRNNTGVGAVAGTPGTLPTNWLGDLGIGQGLASQITQITTVNGISVLDYRTFGTTTSAGAAAFICEAVNQIAASPGQTWTGSYYLALIGGSVSSLTSLNIALRENDSGANFLRQTFASVSSVSSSLVRFTVTATLGASTAFVTLAIRAENPNATAIDYTLRIGLPQLELGAFATSVIPTTTTALTRSADVASVNTLTPWFNASEGTLFSESQQAQNSTAGFPVPVGLSGALGGVDCIEHIWNNSTSTLAGNVVVSSSVQANIGTSGLSRTAIQKFALSYKANDFAACVGGGVVATDTSGTIPVVDRFVLGARPSSALILNGWLSRITYYPRKLSSAELQAITA